MRLWLWALAICLGVFVVISEIAHATPVYRPDKPAWMSVFAYQVAVCETRMNFRHHWGSYEGAWGWYRGTWQMDKPAGAPDHAYQASPKVQYQAFRTSIRRGRYFGCIANHRYAT